MTAGGNKQIQKGGNFQRQLSWTFQEVSIVKKQGQDKGTGLQSRPERLLSHSHMCVTNPHSEREGVQLQKLSLGQPGKSECELIPGSVMESLVFMVL